MSNDTAIYLARKADEDASKERREAYRFLANESVRRGKSETFGHALLAISRNVARFGHAWLYAAVEYVNASQEAPEFAVSYVATAPDRAPLTLASGEKTPA